MRATGMQLKAAVTNFVCYYVVGVPLGIVLALVVGLKTQGMWIGISVAAGLQVGVCVQFTSRLSYRGLEKQTCSNVCIATSMHYPFSNNTSEGL